MRAYLRCLIVTAIVFGCASPVPQILVVVDTDLEVPRQLEGVRFRVIGPRGDERDAFASFAAGDPRPAVLSLAHRGGPLGPLTIVATAEPSSLALQRVARVSFVPGEARMLRLSLLAQCASATCGADETCGEGGCRPIDVAPSELEPWRGPPRTRDASAPFVDAGLDGGPPGCVDASECDDGIACTVEACVDGLCSSTTDDARCSDDGIACTRARCDAREGCVHVPDDGACNDGDPCTIETCEATRGCVPMPDPSVCDDGVACTLDTCDAVLGCASTPQASACDDGVACTIDACDATLGCQSSAVDGSCPSGQYCDARPGGGCAPAPTFDAVYAVITGSCAPCHTNVNRIEGGLDLSSRRLAWANLVDATAVCGEGSNVRVVPRDVRASLLWRSVTGVDPCTARMPLGRSPLGDANIATIERWIRGGALE